jgi:hypothetical protein
MDVELLGCGNSRPVNLSLAAYSKCLNIKPASAFNDFIQTRLKFSTYI